MVDGRYPVLSFTSCKDDKVMELHRQKQWLNWNFVGDDKVPCNQWGHRSGSTRVADYMDYETAKQAAAKRQNHLAFCFTRADPFVGVDLDDCLLPDGSLKEWAIPHVQALCCTYGETSPSKTGIKFYGYGSISDDVRKQYSVGDGQIEIYCHGRFFCFTEWPYLHAHNEIANVQHWIDSFVASNKPVAPVRAATNGAMTYSVISNLQERVQSYLGKAERPGAKSRTRNKTAFSLAGHCFAMQTETGETPSYQLVVQELMNWNQSLELPLEQEEILRCVQNAATKGSPREVKESRFTVPVPGPSPYTSDFFRDDSTAEQPVHVLVPEHIEGEEDIEYDDTRRYMFSAIPSHMLDVPGFVNSTVKYMLDSALFPQPELAVAASLCLQSALVSRKVKSDLYGTRPHIYCCSIAPAGAGKEHGRDVIKHVLNACNLDSMLLGTEELASGPGLLKSMQSHPSNLIQYDEFGRLLTAIMRPGANHYVSDIGTMLIKLHTADKRKYIHNGYADAERNFSINQPGLVLHGTTVPGHFLNGLNTESLSDGLLARISVWFGSYVDSVDPVIDLDSDPIPSEILEGVQWWGGHWERTGILQGSSADFDPQPIVIQSTPEARKAWKAYTSSMAKQARKAAESSGGMLGDAAAERACYSRCVERSVRFALLRACSARRDILVLEDLDWAMTLTETLIRRLLAAVGDDRAENAYHSQVHRVHDLIREAGPDGIRHRDLHRKTQSIDADSRKKIISSLIEAGQVLRIDLGKPRHRANGESAGTQNIPGYVAIRARK